MKNESMTDYINRNQKNKKKSIGNEMLEQEASTEFQSFHLGKREIEFGNQ